MGTERAGDGEKGALKLGKQGQRGKRNSLKWEMEIQNENEERK